jgi:TRAP-type C4-dicarboxylate transport system substrate-binding protein
MNRDTWNGFTPDQKKVHLKAAALLTAKMAIGNFILSNEQSLETIKKDKGVQVIAIGKEFDPIPAHFKTVQRETNIATARNFGVKDPAAIIDAYEKAVEKWRARSKEIGRDIDKFAKVIEDEIFAKVDPGKL